MSGVTGAVVAGVAVTATVGGALIAKKGADNAADAAERMGQAQLEESRRQFAAQVQERALVRSMAMAAAQKSPAEFRAIDRLLQQKDRALRDTLAAIDKDMRLTMEQTDPIIREAGGQVLSLLRGERSKIMDPMLKERERQRAKLENDLASRFGPGYLTSTAGIESLTRFDEATATGVMNANMAALQVASQTFTGAFDTKLKVAQTVGNAYGAASAIDATILGAEQQIANRGVNAIIGATSVTPIDYKSIVDAVGKPFQGDIMRGQAQQQLGGQVMGIGTNLLGQMATFGMMSGMGGGGMSGGVAPSSSSIAAIPKFSYSSPTFGEL